MKKSSIGSLSFLVIVMTSLFPATVFATYAHWKFDEESGITAYDCIGDNNAVLYGDTNWTDGWSKGALSFDGNGDYVQIGATNTLPLIPEGSPFSISCWINIADISGSQAIYGYYSSYSSNYWAYSLMTYQGDLRFVLGNGSTTQLFYDLDSGQNLSSDTWYHLTVTCDGTTIKSYIDGQFAKETTVSLSGVFPKHGDTGTKRELVGGAYGGSTWNFNGKIDDIRIWHRALSNIEVNNVYTDIETIGMYFDGTDDYITCANEANFDFGSNDFTITSWFKIPSDCSINDYTIAGKSLGLQAGGQYKGYRLAYYWGKLMLTVNDGSTTYQLISETSLEKGKWYHAAAMRDGRYLRLYLDGNLYADNQLLPEENCNLDNNYPFAIGAAVYWGQSRFFRGNIDAVAIYNKALTQYEVYENMHFGGMPNQHLVAYYSFDQSSAVDDSGNNNIGTLHGSPAFEDGIRWTGNDEFYDIWSKLPEFAVANIPANGDLYLDVTQSLTASALVNINLDDTDLTVGAHDPYPVSMSEPVYTPYIATDIQPFRLEYFMTELHYGGYYNFDMYEYLLTHGFKALAPYNSTTFYWSHLPEGTIFASLFGLDYNAWMVSNGIDSGRFDQLPFRENITSDHLANNRFPLTDVAQNFGVIDMESPTYPMSLSDLQSQSWYTSGLEDAYYSGFINAELATIDAAHSQGWPKVGIYGWQPWKREFWRIGDSSYETSCLEQWNCYGKYIAAEVDIIYPSVYCFYWNPQNVAYVLHNLDKNIEYINTLPSSQRKPVSPWYWNQLHPGTATWWSRMLPMKNEDFRAMIRSELCLFFING